VTRAPVGCPKHPTSGKPSHGGKTGVLFSIPSNGTIRRSTNAMYATSVAVPLLGMGSSYGHLAAISSDDDAVVSSGLGGTSWVSVRQGEAASA
jgi:hypothetical protein